MLNIKCPYCGERAQKEFAYGGDGTIKRPELDKSVTDKEWDAFVYERKSPRGKHLELWHHIFGSDNGLGHKEILLLMKFLKQ